MTRRYGKDKSCGYRKHGSECLCDVQPLGVEIGIGDMVNDMFMGRQLCDLRGYCAPWTRNDILDYFTDLCTFYDAYAEQKKNPIIIGEFESVTMPEEMRHDKFGGHTKMRHYVRAVYNQYGRTLSDTLRQLGLTADDYRSMLSRGSRKGQPQSQMTMEKIDYLESELTKRERPPMADLTKNSGLSEFIITNVIRDMDDRRKQLHGNVNWEEAHALMVKLSTETTMTSTKILRKVFDETGVMFDKSNPIKVRKRKKETV